MFWLVQVVLLPRFAARLEGRGEMKTVKADQNQPGRSSLFQTDHRRDVGFLSRFILPLRVVYSDPFSFRSQLHDRRTAL